MERKNIERLISKAHTDITRIKGKEYAPNAREIEDKINGGLSDNMSLSDISKKHKVGIEELKKQFIKGIKVEMEHTDDEQVAKEIALDHLYEDPKYYSKLSKIETKESTTASSAGAYSAPAFGPTILKKDINKFHNSNLKEALAGTDAGSYDVPFLGTTPKGRKDPLKISGPDSVKKSRAVRDKNFPKWGGPGGIFIKIKDKCKRFPYCNQGDINAIEVLRETIEQTSKNTGIPKEEIENIIINEIKLIFIDYEN
jgi:hypothetical protein